jgi:hypothetical protein
MTEERDSWEYLRAGGFLHALRQAHETTTRIVFGRLSRSAGFKERSFGYTAYDVLESQLDRVFQGSSEVRRDNLNGSPGWRYGAYRVLLKRYDLGDIDGIRWDQASPTKQAVAKQEFAGDPQLALDLGLSQVGDTPEPVTLVLAHSASEEPLEMELFLGRPRFNADGGRPWWWRRELSRENLGADPRPVAAEPAIPLWSGSDDEADVPLRLRTPESGESEKAR